jgi:hypothetical protein
MYLRNRIVFSKDLGYEFRYGIWTTYMQYGTHSRPWSSKRPHRGTRHNLVAQASRSSTTTRHLLVKLPHGGTLWIVLIHALGLSAKIVARSVRPISSQQKVYGPILCRERQDTSRVAHRPNLEALGPLYHIKALLLLPMPRITCLAKRPARVHFRQTVNHLPSV